MSQDDEYRLRSIEGNAAEAVVAARDLRERVGVQGTKLEEMRSDITELRAEVKDARAGVRTLVLVLVGFAFTVAGSAVALALTLGSPAS